MNTPRPSGAPTHRAGDRNKAPGASGELRPEDHAIIEQARAELLSRGLVMGRSGVRRLYLLHLRREDRGEFLPWLLTYADPTGETAVWNLVGGGVR